MLGLRRWRPGPAQARRPRSLARQHADKLRHRAGHAFAPSQTTIRLEQVFQLDLALNAATEPVARAAGFALFGIDTTSVVPRSGWLETERSPPSCCARSRMPRMPCDSGLLISAGLIPTPLSRT